jgi:hypothetical protein
MERRYKIIIGTLGGAALISGAIFIPKLIETNNAAPEIDVVPKAMVHKIDFSGITLRLDVQLKNPTKVDFKMKYPYFRIVYKGSVIGSSQSINQDVGMPHLGEANFNNILIKIPLFSAFTVVGGLLKSLQSGEEVKMEVTTKTHIDPYWKFDEKDNEWKPRPNLGKTSLIEVTKTQVVTLLKAKQS